MFESSDQNGQTKTVTMKWKMCWSGCLMNCRCILITWKNWSTSHFRGQ